MKTNRYLPFAPSLIMAFLVASPQAQALDWSFQPRLETGFLFYEFDQDPGVFVSPKSDLFQQNTAQGGVKFKDTMPFIGGGVTVFADRFFVDISAQKAFNGEDTSTQISSSFQESSMDTNIEGRFSSFETIGDSDFDREEYAASFGYAVNDRLVIFAGYREAHTDFDIDRHGTALQDIFFVPDGSLITVSNRFSDQLDFELEQDGPFLGATYGWPIERGFLQGVLTANVAVAFLDSTIEQKLTNRRTFDGSATDLLTGETVSLPDQELADMDLDTLEGDTVGLKLGFAWRGSTPVDGLSYTVGISGYQYAFEGKTALADYDETSVNFTLGVAYGF